MGWKPFARPLAAICVVVSGCANNQAQSYDYAPGAGAATQAMTPQEARRVLAEYLRSDPWAYFKGASDVQFVPATVRATFSGIHFAQKGVEVVLPLTQSGDLRFSGEDGGPRSYLSCRADTGSVFNFNWNHPPGPSAYQLGAAIHRLEQEAKRLLSEECEARFQEALKQYRSTQSKPESPACDATRLADEAQAAVKAKDFIGAAELYLQAGERYPTWPTAHFNAALVLGEMGDYELAIREMNRYLALAPDAANARAAQQQLYEWRHKLSASN